MNKYRYEIKFALDEISYSEAMRWLQVNTQATKRYDDRFVNSLYFDNPGYSAIRDNITGLSNRSKYRLRWYSADKTSNLAILPTFEIKTRKGRLGKKDSIRMSNFSESFVSLPLYKIDSKLRSELNKSNFILDDHYVSVLSVQYLREYFEDSLGLRVTFDKDIEFSYVDGLNSKLVDCPKLQYRRYVMELKFNTDLKDYVSQLLSGLNMSPTRHSKYLVGISMFGSILYI